MGRNSGAFDTNQPLEGRNASRISLVRWVRATRCESVIALSHARAEGGRRRIRAARTKRRQFRTNRRVASPAARPERRKGRALRGSVYHGETGRAHATTRRLMGARRRGGSLRGRVAPHSSACHDGWGGQRASRGRVRRLRRGVDATRRGCTHRLPPPVIPYYTKLAAESALGTMQTRARRAAAAVRGAAKKNSHARALDL